MKVQMYNIRRTNKDLSFRRSFSFVRLSLVESLSVDGSFLPHMLGKELGLSCRRCVVSKARVKQFSSKCTEQITNLACACGKKFSHWILTNWTHSRISRSVAVGLATCCRFVSAVAAAMNNTTTSYHIELKDLRTLLKHKLPRSV